MNSRTEIRKTVPPLSGRQHGNDEIFSASLSESFARLVNQRHSIRAFRPNPIDKRVEERILKSVLRAPSAGNLQAFDIFATHNGRVRKKIAHGAFEQTFISEAPLVLVFCAHPARSIADYGERGESLFCVQDATIAAAYAQLAISAEGLASVWVGAFDEAKVSKALNIPAGLRPVVILPVGRPGREPQITSRKPVEALVHWL